MNTSCNTCAYYRCKNSRRTGSGKHFFKFPPNPERQQLWLKNIGNSKLLLLSPTKLKNRIVCEDHFEIASFSNLNRERLNKLAVPIHFDRDTKAEKPVKELITYGPSTSER